MSLHRTLGHDNRPATLSSRASSRGSSDEPLHDGVEVGLLLGADAVAADLAVRDGFKVQGLNQLVDRELLGQVGLVPQDQQRDPFEFGFLQEGVELVTGDRKGINVRRVNDEPDLGRQSCDFKPHRSGRTRSHNGIHAPTVSFPHRSKSGLPSKVPAAMRSVVVARPCRGDPPFQGDMAFLDALHVEAHRRNRAGMGEASVRCIHANEAASTHEYDQQPAYR